MKETVLLGHDAQQAIVFGLVEPTIHNLLRLTTNKNSTICSCVNLAKLLRNLRTACATIIQISVTLIILYAEEFAFRQLSGAVV